MKIIQKCLKLFGLLVIGLTLTTAACKKDKTPRDPFSNLSNQLVCKINGKEWKSNERVGGFFYSLSTGRQYIRLGFTNNQQQIKLYVSAPYNKSYYAFNKTTNSYPTVIFPEDYISFFQSYSDLTPSEEFITNSIDTGRLDIILMDSITNKIKAKFSFVGKDVRTGKKITVADGYFEYQRSK